MTVDKREGEREGEEEERANRNFAGNTGREKEGRDINPIACLSSLAHSLTHRLTERKNAARRCRVYVFLPSCVCLCVFPSVKDDFSLSPTPLAFCSATLLSFRRSPATRTRESASLSQRATAAQTQDEQERRRRQATRGKERERERHDRFNPALTPLNNFAPSSAVVSCVAADR